MLRYNWTVKKKGQQHNIELQMDAVLNYFGTGSGRVLVDGSTVCHWGCNPFRMIPKGSCEFEIGGERASIRSRFTAKSLFFLVIGEQEMPPIESRQRKAKAEPKR